MGEYVLTFKPAENIALHWTTRWLCGENIFRSCPAQETTKSHVLNQVADGEPNNCSGSFQPSCQTKDQKVEDHKFLRTQQT